MVFFERIGINMYAYFGELVIKSRCEDDIAEDTIRETFKNLRAINMKMNPTKGSFRLEESKFLGFIFDKQGVKANPSQVQKCLTFGLLQPKMRFNVSKEI